MTLEHKHDDLEFAIRILNHRDELDDPRVHAWMKDPAHVALLGELAAIRLITIRKRSEQKQPTRSKLSRPGPWWSVAAAAVLLVGIMLVYTGKYTGEKSLALTDDTIQITPGKVLAQLVLANGETIPLGRENREIGSDSLVGLKNDSLDGLTYDNAILKNNGGAMSYNTLRVPVGGYYKLTLEDGTKVWLNSESELRYPVNFSDGTRSVYLKGEAYFDVTHDARHPFVVHARQSSVAVLGTAFNMNAYEDEENMYTTLIRGKVRVTADASGQEVILHPGEQGVMNATGQLSRQEVDTAPYVAWMEGRFVFKSMKLEEIMRQLKRWYDFDLFYQNQEVKSYEFRGSIDRYMEIERVLKMIEETTQVQFTIKGKSITVSKR